MNSIEILCPFPSFQSCIKFYGRSILPPLLPDKNEISKIREQLAAYEAKLTQCKEQKHCSDQKETENDGDDKDSLTTEQLESQLLVSGGTFPFDVNSSSLLDEIQEEEEEASIAGSVKSMLSKAEENSTVKNLESKTELLNPLLHSLEMFQNNVRVFGNINLFVPSPDRISSNSPQPILCPLHLESNSSRGRILSVGSESSVERECLSSSTVIPKSCEDLSCNKDNCSVAQSTDIEKYLDTSTDDSQLTDTSTVIGEKEIAECMNNCDIANSEIVFSDSAASTPVVPFMLESPLLDSSNESIQNPFSVDNLRQSASWEPSFTKSRGKSPLNISKSSSSNNVKHAMQLSLMSSDNCQKRVGPSGDNKLKAGFRHKRSGSYTVEIPSPVLLKSHANCPCMTSPTGSSAPHCTSIELKDCSLISDDGKECLSINKKEASIDKKLCTSTQSDILNQDQEVASQSVLPSEGVSDEALLAALAEAFKKAQEEKIEKLLQLQHEQWMKLETELREEELQLQKHIYSLKNGVPVSGNAVPRPSLENTSDDRTIAELKPEARNQLKPQANPLSVEIYKAPVKPSHIHNDDSCCSVQKPCSERDTQSETSTGFLGKEKLCSDDSVHLIKVLTALSDPEMKKKFDKVSAFAKGYLTRRLLRTVQLQKLLQTVQDTAVTMSALHNKSGGKFPCDPEERELHTKLAKQLTNAFDELHRICFETTVKERMQIIAWSREYEKRSEQRAASASIDAKIESYKCPLPNRNRLSAATVKRLERKQMKNAESMGIRKCASTDCCLSRKASADAVPQKRPHTAHPSGNMKMNALSRKYIGPGQISFQ